MMTLEDNELEMAKNFIESVTGETPSLLCKYETATSPFSFEVPGWSNQLRRLYVGFETETGYAWVYTLHAYGMRFRVYISRLSATVRDLIDDEYLYDELMSSEASIRRVRSDSDVDPDIYAVFEKSMIVT